MSDLQSIPVKTIDGRDSSLGDYAGKVLLVVNTASKCGLTPQYEGLQGLYARYKDAGFAVLGFPANDFRGQEPGSNEEIQSFCSVNYSVDFPMFSKITVAGENKHPLYAALIAAEPKAQGTEVFRQRLQGFGISPNGEPEVLWNFEKFLIDRSGAVVGRFSPDMAPSDERIVAAIERELRAAG